MLVWPQKFQNSFLKLNPSPKHCHPKQPKPALYTFSFPAVQVSFSTSQLHPALLLWLNCGPGMPGMSTDTPDFQINTHNQQWKHTPGLVLLVSNSKACSTDQSGINAIRHSQTQTSSSGASFCMSVTMSRWCLQVTVWDFTSGHCTPELTQRLRFCVRWHRGIMLPVWNIHAAPVWMKRYILLAPTFSAVEVQSRACHGAETNPPCGSCSSVSRSVSHTSQKMAYFLMHTNTCIHTQCKGP